LTLSIIGSKIDGKDMKTASFNGTENIIQNYCITFTHNFNHQHSRIKNSFVIKAAEVNKEQALKIAEILFPDYTDIQIETIENDVLTLTPLEYQHLCAILRDKRNGILSAADRRIKDGIEKGPYIETEMDKFLTALLKKMIDRMNQFPIYHT
jgi:hypothetical protein